jgi:hypothetical protein
MNVQFAILAQSVSVDRFTNRLSIFNVLDQIASPHFPVFLPELCFVVMLQRTANEPNTFDTVIRISNGEAVIGQANMHVDFQGQLVNRSVSNFQGLPIFNPGEIQVNFNFPNGESVGARLPVLQLPLPVPAQQEVRQ